ncbi:hypothetical protein BO71DRAFT_50154 [Aspergillus ellipticus CBS 707.79]|uniref:Uncharacterized protein n=1 Tax=Aspergillus ellipticus CBS 707.79 TaxID=1448320 RepID=A0A319DM78_9EURO|nr:hypothetical protein BO71DRAFT_50154 [Aspergillus ellipticus CBS 707.79]
MPLLLGPVAWGIHSRAAYRACFMSSLHNNRISSPWLRTSRGRVNLLELQAKGQLVIPISYIRCVRLILGKIKVQAPIQSSNSNWGQWEQEPHGHHNMEAIPAFWLFLPS